jgi:hypothetical protein
MNWRIETDLPDTEGDYVCYVLWKIGEEWKLTTLSYKLYGWDANGYETLVWLKVDMPSESLKEEAFKSSYDMYTDNNEE